MKKIVVVLFLTVFCTQVYSQSYFPLSTGKTFTYTYGSDFNMGNPENKTQTTIKDNTEKINGKSYFVAVSSSIINNVKDVVKESYYRVSNNGAVFVLSDDKSKEYVFVKASPKVGDKWSVTEAGITQNIKVLDVKGTIKTPFKTYNNCLILEMTASSQPVRAYLQENLGMVAITMVVNDNEKLFTYLQDK